MESKQAPEWAPQWEILLDKLKDQFGKKPDLNAILFLIGIRELGQVYRKFNKFQKQDLMHIAVCKLMSREGFYELEFTDQDGWPHWKLVKPLPFLDLLSQERYLQQQVIQYFEEIDYFETV